MGDVGAKLLADLATTTCRWDVLAGAPVCPCCGVQMQFVDKDAYGAIRAKCKVHGTYTFQVKP